MESEEIPFIDLAPAEAEEIIETARRANPGAWRKNGTGDPEKNWRRGYVIEATVARWYGQEWEPPKADDKGGRPYDFIVNGWRVDAKTKPYKLNPHIDEIWRDFFLLSYQFPPHRKTDCYAIGAYQKLEPPMCVRVYMLAVFKAEHVRDFAYHYKHAKVEGMKTDDCFAHDVGWILDNPGPLITGKEMQDDRP